MASVKVQCPGCGPVTVDIDDVWLVEGAWKHESPGVIAATRGVYRWKCLCGQRPSQTVIGSTMRFLAASGIRVLPVGTRDFARWVTSPQFDKDLQDLINNEGEAI